MLTQFYRDLITGLENPGEDGKGFFLRHSGMCLNVQEWAEGNGEDARATWILLTDSFSAAGLHREFPFNAGNAFSYYNELNCHTLWQNPQRLAWVYSHAGLPIPEQS